MLTQMQNTVKDPQNSHCATGPYYERIWNHQKVDRKHHIAQLLLLFLCPIMVAAPFR